MTTRTEALEEIATLARLHNLTTSDIASALATATSPDTRHVLAIVWFCYPRYPDAWHWLCRFAWRYLCLQAQHLQYGRDAAISDCCVFPDGRIVRDAG